MPTVVLSQTYNADSQRTDLSCPLNGPHLPQRVCVSQDAGMDQNKSSIESSSDLVAPTVSARDRWRAIIDEHRESGSGVTEFCRRKSIATSSFYGWRQKLDGIARPRVAGSARPKQARFVRVKLAAAQAHSPSPVAAGSMADREAEPLAVVLRNGRRLLLKQGFDPRLLQQAVLALEGLA